MVFNLLKMNNKIIKTTEIDTRIFESINIDEKNSIIKKNFEEMFFSILSSFPINEEFVGKITQTVMDEDYIIGKADECINGFDMLGLEYWRSLYNRLTVENQMKLELTFVYKTKND